MKRLMCTFAIICSVAALGAQTVEDARLAWSNGRLYGYSNLDGDQAGHVSVYRAEPSDTEYPSQCLIEVVDGSGAKRRLLLPLDAVGSVQDLGNQKVLVSGRLMSQSVSTAKIMVVDIDEALTAPVIVDTASFTGRDLISVAWNPADQQLFAWDVVLAEFLHAAWAGVGTALPSTLSSVVVGGGVGTLSPNDLLWKLSVEDVASGAVGSYSQGQSQLKIISVSGTWTLVPDGTLGVPVATWAARKGTGVSTVSVNPQSMGIELWTSGPAPESFIVLDVLAQQSVATGQVSSASTWSAFTAPTVFNTYPGRKYRIVGVAPGTASSQAFRPLVRYGAPYASPTITPGRGFLSPRDVYVGNADSSVAMDFGGWFPSGTQFEVTVAVNFRDPVTGADPVTEPLPGVWILQPSSSVTYTHVSKDGGGHATGANVPVPNLAGLEGLVVFFQFYFADPDGVSTAVSDVFGTTIWGSGGEPITLPGGGGSALMAAGGGTGGSSPGQLAISQWNAQPKVYLTPQKRARFAQLLQGLRRK